MNKQALAFLTMFSLILMLSVYYVTHVSYTHLDVYKSQMIYYRCPGGKNFSYT